MATPQRHRCPCVGGIEKAHTGRLEIGDVARNERQLMLLRRRGDESIHVLAFATAHAWEGASAFMTISPQHIVIRGAAHESEDCGPSIIFAIHG